MAVSDDAPCPRLSHLVKWPDFDGYGFNLHAEKNKSGQFIGKVDDDSPAMLAGLREGDKIIEVNFVNISNENHRQVVERIKSITNETRLLVLDEAADKWYRDRKIVVKSSQPNVIFFRTPVPRPVPGTLPVPCSPDLASLKRPITSIPTKLDDQINQADEKPKVAETPIRAPSSLSNGANSSNSSTRPDSATNSPRSSRSSVSNEILPQDDNNKSNSNGGSSNVGLNLNMTASEMRQLIAQRKKKDAKKANLDLREKYEIIQQM